MRHRRTAILGAIGLMLALPAAGDWLITLEGRLIETLGPWTVEGATLTYTDLEGARQQLDVAELDLEASAETTALRAGEIYEPGGAGDGGEETPPETPPSEAMPKIILYVAGLCPDCIKAQELLEELGVNFVVHDVNKKGKARREYLRKAGHGGGVPVIDFDGRLCFSYDPRVIRERVREIQEKEANEADEADEDPESG